MEKNADIKAIIKFLATKSDKTGKEIRLLIRNKKKQYKNLITDEVACQLVAKDLKLVIELVKPEPVEKKVVETPKPVHIDYPLDSLEKKVKQGLFVNFVAGIASIRKEKVFSRQDGIQGTVAWITLFDSLNKTYRLVFWNERSKEVEEYKEGEKILVEGVKVRESSRASGESYEFHVTQKTRLRKGGEVAVPKLLVSETKEIVKIKLHEIKAGLYNIETRGEIVSLGPLKVFTRKNGSLGKLCKAIIRDDDHYVSLILWDEKTTIAGELQEGTVIKVKNASSKRGNDRTELHLGNYGEIEVVT